jgi:hypothetical protein
MKMEPNEEEHKWQEKKNMLTSKEEKSIIKNLQQKAKEKGKYIIDSIKKKLNEETDISALFNTRKAKVLIPTVSHSFGCIQCTCPSLIVGHKNGHTSNIKVTS